jgi:hypothetical protein
MTSYNNISRFHSTSSPHIDWTQQAADTDFTDLTALTVLLQLFPPVTQPCMLTQLSYFHLQGPTERMLWMLVAGTFSGSPLLTLAYWGLFLCSVFCMYHHSSLSEPPYVLHTTTIPILQTRKLRLEYTTEPWCKPWLYSFKVQTSTYWVKYCEKNMEDEISKICCKRL